MLLAPAGAGICALLLALCDVVAVMMMADMYRMRAHMLVRVRSPVLAITQGSLSLLLLNLIAVQEIMRQARAPGFPCDLLLWASAFSVPMVQEALFLRALRVVVMTNAENRLQDAGLVSQRGGLKHMCKVAAISFTVAVHYQSMTDPRDTHQDSLCYVYRPWPLFMGLQLITAVNALTIRGALKAAQDSLAMAAEVSHSFVWIFLWAIPYYVLLALNDSGVLHMNTSVNLILVPQCLCLIMETFGVSRKKWASRSHRHLKIYTLDGEDEAKSDRYTSCKKLLTSPIMARAFGQHVERSLCFESFQFLQETLAYTTLATAASSSAAASIPEQAQQTPDAVGELYAQYKAIVADFILENSPYEVNICSKMRAQVTQYRAEELFRALSDEARTAIFEPAVDEVARLLDQNLMTGFHATVEFKSAKKADENARLQVRKDGSTAALRYASTGGSPMSSGFRPKSTTESRGTFAMSHNTRKSQISVQADDEELDKIEQQLLEFQQKEQHCKRPVMSQLRSQEKSRLSIESV